MSNEKPSQTEANSNPLQAIRVAFAFLTQFPVGQKVRFDTDAIRQSFYYYPLIGLAIGGLVYVAALVLPFSTVLNSALLVMLMVLSTGGLHLDGLADCTDAWFGGMGDSDKTLLIMKDPQAGAMAVVVVSMLLIVKTAAVFEVLTSTNYLLLILAPMLSRLSVLALFVSTAYIGEGAVGKALAKANHTILYAIIVACIVFSFFIIPEIEMSLVLGMIAAAVVLLRGLMVKRLAGFTGDCAGAQIELVEVLVLIGGCFVLP